MSHLRRMMCVFFVVLAPAAALAQSDASEVRTEFVDMTEMCILAMPDEAPGVIINRRSQPDFDSLVRVERSFLSEIRDAAHAPSMQ